VSGGSFSEHRCRFRAKRDYQPQPVSVSSFDDFNKDLAKRVTDVLVPGGAADFQVVATPATDPIGTLYRKGRSVPFDDTACAPSAEPVPRSLPNAFPSYTLDAKVAADVGLDQALLQGVADLGTSLDAETSFNFSILDARMKVLTDRAVEQLLAASNCAAAATKEMVIVRGYVAGQRQFSTRPPADRRDRRLTVTTVEGNAIFDATGVRLRQGPFTPARVRAALARV
jgi:hypothetical protein